MQLCCGSVQLVTKSVYACVCVTMKKNARQMASPTSDTGDTSSRQQQAQRIENCNKSKRPVSACRSLPSLQKKKEKRSIVNSLLSGSFLIKFSSLSATTKIEELTAGSDEKTQRSPPGIEPRVLQILVARSDHTLSDPAVSSSIFVGAEREEKQFTHAAVHVCVCVCVYYRKRGSASYIVREVLLVRERDRERDTERERRK